jgi:hypothetical protein
MKKLALLFLLICSIAVQAQTVKNNLPTLRSRLPTNDNNIPKEIIGKWVNVNNDALNNQKDIKSITFHANSKINIVGKDKLVVQNYQVFKESDGYRIEVQELITRKPITYFTILMVNKNIMVLALKGKAQRLNLTLKKADTADTHLLPVNHSK